jgi:hypothetical protein
VGQQQEELLAAVAADEVALPKRRAEHGGHGGEHLVAAAVAVGVVDPLEVVQVEQGRRQRRDAAGRLGHHALDGVLDGPVVGQPGERVGGGPDLGDGQVAQVGQDRGGLGDRLPDALVGLVGGRVGVVDQDRPDHLAADQQRLAGDGVRQRPADPADQQRRPALPALVAAPEPHRQAGAGLGSLQGAGQRALRRHRGGRLQPVGAVVAVQDGHLAAGDGPLEVVLEEVVGLGLGLAELHGVGELGLGRLVAALLATAPDHLVEGLPELGQLVGPADGELAVRLPVGHPGREPGVGPHPGHDVADQQQRDGQPDQRP